MPFVIVGTYGQKLGHVDGRAEGCYVLQLNADGSLSHVPGADGSHTQLNHKTHETELCMKNLTYATHRLLADGTTCVVYFASEGCDTLGSVVAAYLDRETGQLTFINQSDAGGHATCHVSIPAGGKHIFAANYMGSTCAMPLNEDGSVGERSDLIRLPPPQHELLFQPFPRKHRCGSRE
jgi:6-phosphogluconolactonase